MIFEVSIHLNHSMKSRLVSSICLEREQLAKLIIKRKAGEEGGIKKRQNQTNQPTLIFLCWTRKAATFAAYLSCFSSTLGGLLSLETPAACPQAVDMAGAHREGKSKGKPK